MSNEFEWWGAVALDRSHIREVVKAFSEADAKASLMQGWSERLKALYTIKRVVITVADESRI